MFFHLNKSAFLLQNDAKMDVDDSSGHKFPQSVDIPVPPGRWRLGVAHAKAKNILLRFATKSITII